MALCGAVACTTRERVPEIEPKRPRPQTPAISAAAPASGSNFGSSPVEVAPVVPAPPSEPFTLLDDRDRAIEVYPPVTKQPRAPIVVFLHATCMQPSPVCDRFGSAGRDPGWLVCPSGNSTCYGEPDWHGPGPEKAAFLERALAKVEAQIPSFLDERPGVLVGWSRGAFAARDILEASLTDAKSAPLAKRFRGLVLLAAHVTPKLSTLTKVGITRVVMAAGDQDGARPTMVAAVDTLRAGGLEVRYVSLGNIGHAWPKDFETRMREPIAWAAGP